MAKKKVSVGGTQPHAGHFAQGYINTPPASRGLSTHEEALIDAKAELFVRIRKMASQQEQAVVRDAIKQGRYGWIAANYPNLIDAEMRALLLGEAPPGNAPIWQWDNGGLAPLRDTLIWDTRQNSSHALVGEEFYCLRCDMTESYPFLPRDADGDPLTPWHEHDGEQIMLVAAQDRATAPLMRCLGNGKAKLEQVLEKLEGW